jgi:hypothetical protein
MGWLQKAAASRRTPMAPASEGGRYRDEPKTTTPREKPQQIEQRKAQRSTMCSETNICLGGIYREFRCALASPKKGAFSQRRDAELKGNEGYRPS